MRSTNWKTVSTLVTMALLAGCQDRSVTAPDAASVTPASTMMAPTGRPSLDLFGGKADDDDAEFSVGPRGGVYFAGNHAVVFPANSICDPAKSSYGPDTWDAPCPELKSTIHIHATVRTLNGRTWVDFSPALRFVPSTSPARWVWMYMYTPGAVQAHDISRFNILYAASIGGALIDETKADASLRTYVDTHFGIASRRIKHFSGYTASSGRSCDPSQPDCTPGDSTTTAIGNPGGP